MGRYIRVNTVVLKQQQTNIILITQKHQLDKYNKGEFLLKFIAENNDFSNSIINRLLNPKSHIRYKFISPD